MRILGVNGRTIRSHDASVSMIENGKPIFALEEERLSRVRHAYASFPFGALNKCMEEHHLSIADIDRVAVGWDYPKLHEMRGLAWDHRQYCQMLGGIDPQRVQYGDL